MLERRAVDGALREVVRRLPDEVHVRPEEDRPEGVVTDLRDAQLVEQDAAGDDDSHDHGERGRQDPAGAPRIEASDRDRPTAAVRLGLLRVLGREQARDQVAGDDEEHVDAEEPAVETRRLEVVEHDEQHRDGPQPLHVTTEPDHPARVVARSCREAGPSASHGTHAPLMPARAESAIRPAATLRLRPDCAPVCASLHSRRQSRAVLSGYERYWGTGRDAETRLVERVPGLSASQGRQDSNLQPPVLETGALPIELRP